MPTFATCIPPAMIEQALGENIHFMWLSGNIRPDHNTIANFRSGKLKGKFKKIFNQVLLLLAQQQVLNIKDIYVDGTKIEANANRYTFVWGKSMTNSRERIKKTAQRTLALCGDGLRRRRAAPQWSG